MGQKIRVPPSPTSFPQRELHLSSLLHCPAFEVMSLGDGSSAGFTYIFQVCCCGLAGCHQGYFGIRVTFWCPICSPSPGSSSYMNTMQLFLGKGWQVENSEDNEAKTPCSPAGSASPLKAAHSQPLTLGQTWHLVNQLRQLSVFLLHVHLPQPADQWNSCFKHSYCSEKELVDVH